MCRTSLLEKMEDLGGPVRSDEWALCEEDGTYATCGRAQVPQADCIVQRCGDECIIYW